MGIRAKSLRLAVIVLAAAVISLCGCIFYDLGDFKDEEKYYSSFGDVGLIANDGAKHDYSLKDYFYNKNSVNDFSGDIVEADEYVYFVLPFKSNMKLDSIALFVNAGEAAVMNYSVFLTDRIPVKIRNYDAPVFVQAEDEEGNPKFDGDGNPVWEQEKDGDGNPEFDEDGNPVYKKIDYDDPDVATAAATGSFSVKENRWSSFTVDGWTVNAAEEKSVQVYDGDYLLIRFENNSGIGKDSGLQRLSFKTTNLLVRATGVLSV